MPSIFFVALQLLGSPDYVRFVGSVDRTLPGMICHGWISAITRCPESMVKILLQGWATKFDGHMRGWPQLGQKNAQIMTAKLFRQRQLNKATKKHHDLLTLCKQSDAPTSRSCIWNDHVGFGFSAAKIGHWWPLQPLRPMTNVTIAEQHLFWGDL